MSPVLDEVKMLLFLAAFGFLAFLGRWFPGILDFLFGEVPEGWEDRPEPGRWDNPFWGGKR